MHWLRRQPIPVTLCTTNDRPILAPRFCSSQVDLPWFTAASTRGSGQPKLDPRALHSIFTAIPARGSTRSTSGVGALMSTPARGGWGRCIAVLSSGLPRHAFLRKGRPGRPHLRAPLAPAWSWAATVRVVEADVPDDRRGWRHGGGPFPMAPMGRPGQRLGVLEPDYTSPGAGDDAGTPLNVWRLLSICRRPFALQLLVPCWASATPTTVACVRPVAGTVPRRRPWHGRSGFSHLLGCIRAVRHGWRSGRVTRLTR
jgi:hypothetical protein